MAILHGPPATVIRTLRQLAQQYEGQGNYNAAIFFYTHVIEQQQLLYGEVHEEVALSQLELGRLYRESNQFAEAQATYEASLAMWRSLYGEDHPMILASLEILATLQDDLLPPSPPEMEVASLSLKADEAVNLPTQDDTKPSTPSAEASSTELSFPDATTTQPDVQSDIQPEGDSQKEPSTSLTEYQSSTLNSHLSESNPSESNPSEDLHSEDLDNDLPDVLLDDAPDMPADSV
jgi:tetratricopeptide (TPR) repeat protein